MAIKVLNPIISKIESTPVLQEKTVTENGEITADDGYDGLSKVTVEVQSVAAFNIHYGTEAPQDTSKLWVETDIIPNNVTLALKPPVAHSTRSFGSDGNFNYDRVNDRALTAVGSIIYSFGGVYRYYSTSQKKYVYQYQKTIKTFNTETAEVTTLPVSLPVGASTMTAVTCGTKIYLFGGYTGTERLTSCYVFDTETEEIEELPVSLPIAVNSMTGVVKDTAIYLFGGNTGTEFLSSCFILNTETLELTIRENFLPAGMSSPSVLIIDNYFYLLYSYISKGINVLLRADFSDFYLSNPWKVVTRNSMVWGLDEAVNIGKKIFILGSESDSEDVHMYDIETEELTHIGVYYGTSSSFGINTPIVVNGKIYVFLVNSASNSYDPAIEYSVTFPLEQSHIWIQVGTNNNTSFTFSSGEYTIGANICSVYIGNENNEAEKVNAYIHNGKAWALI